MRITTFRTVWIVSLAIAVVASIGAVCRLPAGEPPGQKDQPAEKARDAEEPLKNAMLTDARKVFEQDLARSKAGLGVQPEELYLWSARWLEAELDLASDAAAKTAALKAHLDRMKSVEKMADGLAKTGQGREADAAAGRYHRAQAELWVARGRMK